MKKINKGFTLAEVLFALAIIGIVATMTLPSIQASFLKQQVATGLAKAINTLENANALALQENNAKDLETLGATTHDKYLDLLQDHIYGVKLGGTISYTTPTGSSFNTYYNLSTKDGILFSRKSTSTSTKNVSNSALPRMYSGKYYDIYVDTNGAKKPNVQGKDLYTLWVDTKGSVIPAGGDLYEMYEGGSVYTWRNKCKRENWGNSTLFNSWYCAGSIVDNGYKVIHF